MASKWRTDSSSAIVGVGHVHPLLVGQGCKVTTAVEDGLLP